MKGNRIRNSNIGRLPKEPLTKKTLEGLRIRERKVAEKSKTIKSVRSKIITARNALERRSAVRELPLYQTIHAAYIASMGKINLSELAQLNNITVNRIISWKKKNKWNNELIELKKAAEDAIQAALISETREKGPLYMVTPEQLRNVFAEMTGKQIELAVSELLSNIFVEDLRDLAKINKRLRYWLDMKNDDGTDMNILPEALKDIASTKVTVIKAVRLLFGLDGDSGGKKSAVDITNNNIIEVLVQGPAASSLLRIAQDIKIIDTKTGKD